MKKIAFSIGFVGLLGWLAGCASLISDSSDNSHRHPTASRTFDSVFLCTPEFAGMFGDNTREWNGINYDNHSAVGLHPLTKSEFIFFVRDYPTMSAEFLRLGKTNELRTVATEIKAAAKGGESTESFEVVCGWQYYSQRGKYTREKISRTFLRVEYKAKRVEPTLFDPKDDAIIVHYLTDLNPDDTTESSRAIFHAMAVIPVEVSPEIRTRLLATMRRFIEHMDLIRK